MIVFLSILYYQSTDAKQIFTKTTVLRIRRHKWQSLVKKHLKSRQSGESWSFDRFPSNMGLWNPFCQCHPVIKLCHELGCHWICIKSFFTNDPCPPKWNWTLVLATIPFPEKILVELYNLLILHQYPTTNVYTPQSDRSFGEHWILIKFERFDRLLPPTNLFHLSNFGKLHLCLLVQNVPPMLNHPRPLTHQRLESPHTHRLLALQPLELSLFHPPSKASAS